MITTPEIADQQRPRSRPRPVTKRPMLVKEETETSSISVGTLVLWLLVLTVGVMGIYLPYSLPARAVSEAPAVQAEMLNVELTSEPMATPISSQPSVDVATPPSMPDTFVTLEMPPMIAVAEPSAVSFALPIEGPTRVVAVQQASYAKPATESASAAAANGVGSASTTQRLTYGEGEGKQPAPEYPRQSLREGQQGVVTIRFSVGEHGHVISAKVASPSPWRLLNEAALRVVREQWHFKAGLRRLYEVDIRFNLQN